MTHPTGPSWASPLAEAECLTILPEAVVMQTVILTQVMTADGGVSWVLRSDLPMDVAQGLVQRYAGLVATR